MTPVQPADIRHGTLAASVEATSSQLARIEAELRAARKDPAADHRSRVARLLDRPASTGPVSRRPVADLEADRDEALADLDAAREALAIVIAEAAAADRDAFRSAFAAALTELEAVLTLANRKSQALAVIYFAAVDRFDDAANLPDLFWPELALRGEAANGWGDRGGRLDAWREAVSQARRGVLAGR